ncbi:unnamed protein product [Caenorhabditis angaria]|uniref:Beta-lactamase-related domain-containing protein n=1 Tax=Caenorhabditis angaria TaxID=860376 RepID=A0A9P1IUS6_9PELO|nr:unnamed protein product [Caenorhabditis angaria]
MYFLLFLFIIFLKANASQIQIRTLTELWENRREAQPSHLFPTRNSKIYPEFAEIPRGQSYFHLTSQNLAEKLTEIQGGREWLVHSVCSYHHLNSTFFVLNKIRGSGFSEVLIDANMTEIENKVNAMTAKRVKINYICVGANENTYSAVWHHSADFVNHYIVESGPITEIVARNDLQTFRGYYCDCFQTYQTQNLTNKAIIIWRKGFGRKSKISYGTNLEKMLNESQIWEGDHLKVVQFSNLPPKRPGLSNYSKWLLWQGEDFKWSSTSNIPKVISTNNSWPGLDSVVESHIREFNIPSISISIFRDNLEEYTVAYGYADILKNITTKPEFRYRIASVSKMITAMGMGELLTEYSINLMSPVFGEFGILRELCHSECHHVLKNLKIIHLLEHSSGAWPHTKKYEFEKMEQNQTEFLRTVLAEQIPLQYPGISHIYSNIGYILLGRIIEKVSGIEYEEYIRRKIFEPLGINGTIGKEFDDQEEVVYYSHDNANAYTSWNTTRLNSAAGWAMTAKNVAKLFNHLEQNKLRKYRWIITPSAVRWTYGRGIQLGFDGSIYHIGSLAGTEAIGFSYHNVQVAILTNLRGKNQNEQTGWMEKLCRSIAKGAKL